MSSPLIRLLDEGTTGMRERDRARDVLEILPKPDAATRQSENERTKSRVHVSEWALP